jgi:hypothetical protein
VTQPGVGTNRYSYSFNDPVNISDPSGNFGIVGAMIGAIVGGGVQLAVDFFSDGRINSPMSDYIGAAVGGAVVGATGGLGGSSVLSFMAAGGVGGGAGEIARAVSAGESLSPARIGTSMAFGGALAIPGGHLISRQTAALSSNAVSSHAKGVIGEQVVRRQYAAIGYFSSGKRPIEITGVRTPTGRPAEARIDFNMSFLRTRIGEFGVEAKFRFSNLTVRQRQAMAVDPFTVARVSALQGAGLGGTVPGVVPLTFGSTVGSVLGGSIAVSPPQPAYAPLRITIGPGG